MSTSDCRVLSPRVRVAARARAVAARGDQFPAWALDRAGIEIMFANRIATDVGASNQTACSNCRMVYVTCGTDEDGIEKLKKLGKLTYEAFAKLPDGTAVKCKRRGLKITFNVGTKKGEGLMRRLDVSRDRAAVRRLRARSGPALR